eukprot:15464443-Alexandrium_andersonii.AAC.1
MAVLATTMVPTALRIATDSKAVVVKFNRLVECLRAFEPGAPADSEVTGTPPWCPLVPPNSCDADLWSALARALIGRGIDSVKLTKVKAHCTHRSVECGEMTSLEWIGNSNADVYADVGVREGRPWMIPWLKLMLERIRKSTKLVHAVQDMMIAILRQSSKELKAARRVDFAVKGKAVLVAPPRPPEGRTTDVR